MELLILGGTIFLGRHLVELALERGHRVTLFNRGQHGAELFPEAEKLRGDRKTDLSALTGRSWDAAVDTCGYVPRVVRASAELLAERVAHYTFVSSISVYADLKQAGADERAPVETLDDPTVEEVSGETYGPLKALCEQAAEAALPGRTLNVRPGLIVGPHDPSHRFTYWPRRVAQGGEALAPGTPDAPVQNIDARALAAWMLTMIEARQAGVFNATGPDFRLSMGQTLETCRAISGSDARFTWVADEFLTAAGVAPYTEMPLWVPASEGGDGFSSVDCTAARKAGLTFRPLKDTVRDTLEWDASPPEDAARPAG
ncbi:MAG: NAD-dependent epimerase/dehydratase family protein, partial [Actinomycetota bacterium]